MTVPERWQEVIDLALAPVAWIPRMQEALIAFFTSPAERWTMALKYIFLLIPALLAVAAVWITMLSVYTLPFRASRVHYVSMMLLAWWDAARAAARRIYGPGSTPGTRTPQPTLRTRLISYDSAALPLVVLPSPSASMSEFITGTEPRTAPSLSSETP